MATVLLGLIMASVVGIWHSDAAASDGAAKCEGASDGSCADAHPAEETFAVSLVQSKLHLEKTIESGRKQYQIVNKSSDFTQAQIDTFLNTWQTMHSDADSYERIFMHDACMIMMRPPLSSSDNAIVTICGHVALANSAQTHPDLASAVIGDVVAAGDTLSFRECSSGTDITGGEAEDGVMHLVEDDGILKVQTAAFSNFASPCSAVPSLMQTHTLFHRNGMNQYQIVNRSSSFTQAQIDTFLNTWQTMHSDADSYEQIFTHDACMILMRPPLPSSEDAIVPICGHVALADSAQTHPDLASAVMGDVVAAMDTLSFREFSNGTDIGGEADDGVMHLVEVDGILKIDFAAFSNFDSSSSAASDSS